MKKIIIFFFSISFFVSCKSAKVKEVEQKPLQTIFLEKFTPVTQSPWIGKSKKYLSFKYIGSKGLLLNNTSPEYSTEINYSTFPVDMTKNFITTIKGVINGKGAFTFYLSYKDANNKELISYYKDKGYFKYSNYKKDKETIILSKKVIINDPNSLIKIIQKENILYVFINDQLVLSQEKRSNQINNFGFGLSPQTSILLNELKIDQSKNSLSNFTPLTTTNKYKNLSLIELKDKKKELELSLNYTLLNTVIKDIENGKSYYDLRNIDKKISAIYFKSEPELTPCVNKWKTKVKQFQNFEKLHDPEITKTLKLYIKHKISREEFIKSNQKRRNLLIAKFPKIYPQLKVELLQSLRIMWVKIGRYMIEDYKYQKKIFPTNWISEKYLNRAVQTYEYQKIKTELNLVLKAISKKLH